jgi:gliding motility-associated-like protein
MKKPVVSMKTLIVTLILCGLLGRVNAQCPAMPAGAAVGNFSIQEQNSFSVFGDALVTCPGAKVTIQAGAAITNPTYWYAVNDRTLPTSGGTATTTFTFNIPGDYCIVQKGTNATGQTTWSFQRMRIVDPAPVSVKVSNCSRGIVNLTISPDTKENDPNSSYSHYRIDWNDGQIDNLAKSNIILSNYMASRRYTAAGERNITVQGLVGFSGGIGATGCGNKATVKIAPILTELYQPELFRLEMKGNGTADLTYRSQEGGAYEIFRQSGNTYITTGVKGRSGNTQVGTVTFGVDERNSTCFRLQISDDCGVKHDSQDLCTIPTSVADDQGKFNISWVRYPQEGNFKTYGMIRNGTDYVNRDWIQGMLADVNNISLKDNGIGCNQETCYRMKAVISQGVLMPDGNTRPGEMVSVSAPVCKVAQGEPKQDALTDALVTVEDNMVKLFIRDRKPDLAEQFNLYRRNDDGNGFALVESSLGTSFVDKVANPSQKAHCYKISYTTACGSESELSEEFCPIYLKSGGTFANWTSYQRFLRDLSEYYVERLSDDMRSILTTNNVDQALRWELEDDDTYQDVIIRIRGRSKDQLNTYSNVVTLTRPPRVFVPDVFTPNGDGVNDVFAAKGVFLKKITLTIFDRWGNSIYQTEDKDKGWDGSLSGQNAEDGVYAYQLQIEDFKGLTFFKRGNVFLVR